MKTKVSTLSRIYADEVPEAVKTDPAEKMTPTCSICGETNISLCDDAFVLLRGMWMSSEEFNIPIFVLDPDTAFRVVELPNKQLAIVPDTEGHPTWHSHVECIDFLLKEMIGEDDDEEIE